MELTRRSTRRKKGKRPFKGDTTQVQGAQTERTEPILPDSLYHRAQRRVVVAIFLESTWEIFSRCAARGGHFLPSILDWNFQHIFFSCSELRPCILKCSTGVDSLIRRRTCRPSRKGNYRLALRGKITQPGTLLSRWGLSIRFARPQCHFSDRKWICNPQEFSFLASF